MSETVYIIAVRFDDDVQGFQFKTEKDRQEFIEDITEKYPEISYMTTEA